jgi:hypothetical protein
VPPQYRTAAAVATKVIPGTITSSPGRRSRHRARRMAFVPGALRGLGIVSPQGEPEELIGRVEAELR